MKFLAFILALSVCLESCGNEQKKLSAQEISKIESSIALPKGAYSITEYDRYYSLKESNGDRKLIGYYLYKETKNPTIHWVNLDTLPMMMDGGCAVIQLEYDLNAKKLLSVFCHGDA